MFDKNVVFAHGIYYNKFVVDLANCNNYVVIILQV